MRVSRASLGQLTPLGEGGFGKVYRVSGYQLPGEPGDLAYKEFFSQNQAEQAHAAANAVAFRAGLSQADRDDLDRCAVWPRALVEDSSGTVTGLLMRLIPGDFFFRALDPDSGQPAARPREMSWLIYTADQLAQAQADLREVDKNERLVLLGKLIYAVGRLHKHRWVFGDLSFKNAVFSLDPPRILLLDCDGAAALADQSRQQASTPFWDPPECPIDVQPGQRPPQNRQDDITDVYKLGLAILRCLAPGSGAATSRRADRCAGELDAEGAALAARAVATDRASRPSAKELYGYFYRTVSARVQPPEVAAARLVTPLRVRGQDVRIEWQISNAATATVSVGHGQRVQVDLAQHPQGYVFRPDESGQVVLEVSNRFGAVRVGLGEVTLYELPPFQVDFGYLPRLRVPPLTPFSMEPLRPVLEQIPVPRLAELPAVPPLNTFGVVRTLMANATMPVPLPRLDEAVTEVTDTVLAMLRAEAANADARERRAYLASQGHVEEE
jgi:hypothetical protein